MHFPLEIIMPPCETEKINKCVEEVMAPFDENNKSEEASTFRFWDWYEIGGRYSGNKIITSLSDEKIEDFYKKLKILNVTVSGARFGKNSLDPISQIPLVDELWRDMFPESGLEVCPLFSHSGKSLQGDISLLKDISPKSSAYAVLIADHSRWGDQSLRPVYLIHKEMWNGVSFIRTDWDSSILSAVKKYEDKINERDKTGESWKRKGPKGDWFVITVDYHS